MTLATKALGGGVGGIVGRNVEASTHPQDALRFSPHTTHNEDKK